MLVVAPKGDPASALYYKLLGIQGSATESSHWIIRLVTEKVAVVSKGSAGHGGRYGCSLKAANNQVCAFTSTFMGDIPQQQVDPKLKDETLIGNADFAWLQMFRAV